jgi:hypothetical protein
MKTHSWIGLLERVQDHRVRCHWSAAVRQSFELIDLPHFACGADLPEIGMSLSNREEMSWTQEKNLEHEEEGSSNRQQWCERSTETISNFSPTALSRILSIFLPLPLYLSLSLSLLLLLAYLNDSLVMSLPCMQWFPSAPIKDPKHPNRGSCADIIFM